MNFFRSQRPAFKLLFACGIERASEINKAMVCSAVVIVLPSGAFITTMPRIVAAGTGAELAQRTDLFEAFMGLGEEPAS